jgi:hypothetical protein
MLVSTMLPKNRCSFPISRSRFSFLCSNQIPFPFPECSPALDSVSESASKTREIGGIGPKGIGDTHGNRGHPLVGREIGDTHWSGAKSEWGKKIGDTHHSFKGIGRESGTPTGIGGNRNHWGGENEGKTRKTRKTRTPTTCLPIFMQNQDVGAFCSFENRQTGGTSLISLYQGIFPCLDG